MTRIVTSTIALCCMLFGTLGVAVLPSAAQADCAHWDISGQWVLDQSNGFGVGMDLQQTGTTISGNGWYRSKTFPGWVDFGEYPKGAGTVSGTIDNNNNIQFSTSWGGEYKGGVASDGFIGGVTSPKGGSEVATWRSLRPVTTCLTATTPPSSAEPAPDKPVKALGKRKPSTAAPSEPAEKMNPASVLLDVEIYNKPGGGDAGGVVIGELAKGTQGILATCDADNWCHVLQWMGNAPIHRGWVYSGPDYKSLNF